MKNIFKIASLLAAAVMLFACDKEQTQNGGEGGGEGSLQIISDKDVIQANGQDAATVKVMFDGKDVTAESVLYDENDNEVILVDGKFTASAVGEYRFYANYGTITTFDKSADDNGLYVIKAIDVAVPTAAKDDEPENLSFVHRTFLTQYTGTGCGYCPYMIKQLRELMADKTIPEKAVLAAAHSGYNAADPAAINAPKAPGGSYPFLQVDLAYGYTHNTGIKALYGLIDQSLSDPAKAGISVSPAYYEDKDVLVVKVAVKAAEDGIFNVGAWLLEDEIYGQQSDYDNVGDDSYDTHENCVRIADSKYKGTWFGYELGQLAKGEVAEKTFVMNIKDSWVVDNLKLAVFASYGEADGSRISYTVCNAVYAQIDTPTPFEYAK